MANADQISQIFCITKQDKAKTEKTRTEVGLAAMLHAQGRYGEAEDVERQILQSSERVLGSDHPETLSSMNNLAQTLYAQGDLAGARKLQEQVVEARARLLGKEHPNTLTSLNNLAQTLYAQGDLAGARKLQEQVLEAALLYH
jgi:tetratricopeptide (TPR) repeat protein